MSVQYSSYHRRLRYKSYMERQIAELFEKSDIPFIYEKPTAVVDYGKTKIWYPDFTLGYGIVVEYFGVSNNKEYEYRASHKLDVYRRNQIPVITLYPKELNRSWRTGLLEKISKKLKEHSDDLDGKILQTQD